MLATVSSFGVSGIGGYPVTVEGYIIDVKGRQMALPVILSYRVRHGMGVPCDSFELTCKYEPEAEDALKGGCCFLAVDREGVVFRGILDEYEAEIGLSGKLLSVSGRGMAARRSQSRSQSKSSTVSQIMNTCVPRRKICMSRIPTCLWPSIISGHTCLCTSQ